MAKKNLPQKNVPAPKPARVTPNPTPKSPTTSWGIGSFWALAVLTAVIFSAVVGHEFVNWDDPLNITENPQLTVISTQNFLDIFTHNIIGNYNPLPIVTFFIEKSLFGVKNLSAVIHINNLLLHIGTVYFVWKLARAMQIGDRSSWAIAFLFALHPMRVESVAWATERKDVLFAIFYFAGLYQYVLWRKDESRKRLILIGVLFVFSLFSKVQAVSFPLSLLALDYWLGKKFLPFSETWKRIWEKWFFWLGSLAMGVANVATLIAVKSIGDSKLSLNFFDRLLIACQSFCVYVIKLFYPYYMSPLYPYPTAVTGWEFWLAPLGVLAAFWAMWWAFRMDRKEILFGIFFFGVNFIFVSQLVGAGQGYLADRFTYVGYFGFFVALVVSLQKMADTGGGRFAAPVQWISAFFGVFYCFLTFQQVKIWQNSADLWTHALGYQSSVTPYLNRGMYLRDTKKDPKKALPDFKKAAELQPTDVNPWNSLGKTYFDMGNDNAAREAYEKAIQLDSTKSEVWANLASIYGRSNRLDEALRLINKAIAMDSTNEEAFLTRSLAYQTVGRYAEALEDDKKYLTLNPQNAEIWFECANLRTQIGGQNQAAIDDLTKAINIEKKVEFFEKRANLHQTQGNAAAANADLEQVRLLRRK